VAPNVPKIDTAAIVLVEWLDAEHQFGWQEGNHQAEEEPLLNCFTVGWLMKQTKTHVKVCQTLSSDNHAQTLVIPIGMIAALTVLQQPKKRNVTTNK
jgi:hypothetical protein